VAGFHAILCGRFLQMQVSPNSLDVSCWSSVCHQNRQTGKPCETHARKMLCLLFIYPGQDIAIDETTVRSTAGWPFASTIPKSPISGVSKHVLKAYVLTDSFTGYASVF